MAVEITSGKLRHPVTFKQPSSLKNDEGGIENTYTDYLSTSAYVEGFNQYRTTEAEATTLIGALDFYVRYSTSRATINKDFLIDDGKDWTIHKIERVDEHGRTDLNGMFLRFTAKVKE